MTGTKPTENVNGCFCFVFAIEIVDFAEILLQSGAGERGWGDDCILRDLSRFCVYCVANLTLTF